MLQRPYFLFRSLLYIHFTCTNVRISDFRSLLKMRFNCSNVRISCFRSLAQVHFSWSVFPVLGRYCRCTLLAPTSAYPILGLYCRCTSLDSRSKITILCHYCRFYKRITDFNSLLTIPYTCFCSRFLILGQLADKFPCSLTSNNQPGDDRDYFPPI